MNVRDIRRKAGLNQVTFWSRLGVTQSGGSRYESGRTVPKPVQKLVALAFGSKTAALKLFEELRGNLPDTDSEYPYYVVLAGDLLADSKQDVQYTSEPVSSFKEAADLFKNAPDQFWPVSEAQFAKIEYHFNKDLVYSFTPCEEASPESPIPVK